MSIYASLEDLEERKSLPKKSFGEKICNSISCFKPVRYTYVYNEKTGKQEKIPIEQYTFKSRRRVAKSRRSRVARSRVVRSRVARSRVAKSRRSRVARSRRSRVARSRVAKSKSKRPETKYQKFVKAEMKKSIYKDMTYREKIKTISAMWQLSKNKVTLKKRICKYFC